MSDQPFEGISPFVQQYLSDTGQDDQIGRNDTYALGYQAACAALSTLIFDVYGEYNPPCGPSRRNQITGQHWVQPQGNLWGIPDDEEDDDAPIVIVQQAPPVDPKLIERIYYMGLTTGAAGEFARGMAWMATEIARTMDFPLAIRQPAALPAPAPIPSTPSIPSTPVRRHPGIPNDIIGFKIVGEVEEWEPAPRLTDRSTSCR